MVWVEKMIHWELFKRLKFNQTNNTESILENETYKVLWDFEIQTNYLISTSRPDLVIVNKKIRPLSKIKRKAKREISTKTLLEN